MTTEPGVIRPPVGVLEFDLLSSRIRTPGPDGPPDDAAATAVLLTAHDEPVDFITVQCAPRALSSKPIAPILSRDVAERLRSHECSDSRGAGSADKPSCKLREDELLKSAPYVSVVIPTRESPEALTTCANSILESKYPSTRFELIVVDSGPVTDRTVQTVRRLQERRPDASIEVLQDRPGGAARARNLGFRASSSPLVVFADGDVVVRESWLLETVAGFNRSPDIGCVTGLVLPLRLDTKAQLLFQEFGGYGKGFLPIIYRRDQPPPAIPLFPYQAGIFGTGASMAFRRSAFAEIGGMDEALGPGTPTRSGDDSELLLRAVLRGIHLMYNPRAVVWHPDEPTMDGLYEQVRGYGIGLGAYLTRTALSDSQHAFGITRRLAAGASHLIRPGSGKNAARSTTYPRGLTAAEILGVARGPGAYLRSRRRRKP